MERFYEKKLSQLLTILDRHQVAMLCATLQTCIDDMKKERKTNAQKAILLSAISHLSDSQLQELVSIAELMVIANGHTL